MTTLNSLQQDLQNLANPEKKFVYQRFFKTGPGEYGEGDVFLGLTTPQLQKIAHHYAASITLPEVAQLLGSKTHEYRLAALTILVKKYQRASITEKDQLVQFYLAHTAGINNWDLVDISCPKILGDYLLRHPHHQKILNTLVTSTNMWEQRIAMITTLAFIKANQLDQTFILAQKLLNHPHDLIHKAVGWMLREAGKKDQPQLEEFLQTHYAQIPRTALRYAIEKFPENKRQQYLKGTF